MLRDGGGERRTAGADLASKPGLGARSAAGGGEVPPARGARARLAALVLGGEERRGREIRNVLCGSSSSARARENRLRVWVLVVASLMGKILGVTAVSP